VDRLDAMRLVVRVAELGSFSAVAQQLGVARSVVTRQVAALETHLRVKLLARSTRRLSLTSAGAGNCMTRWTSASTAPAGFVSHAVDVPMSLKSRLVLVALVLVPAIAGAVLARDNLQMPLDLFRFQSAQAIADWSAIDDAVMGGVSSSRLRHDAAGHAVFEGVVALDNNGGFASVRSRPLDLGAPGAVSYVLEVRGDGKRYKLNLRTDDAFDGVNYQASFETPPGAWTLVRLPVSGFSPTFRGRTVPDAPPLDPIRVRQVGLMIADRQVGAFALAVRAIGVE